jgi:CRISPR-associated protein Csm4
MEAIILKCKPNSQFHFGQVAIDADTSLNDTSEFIHSDTLFSALINLAARMYSEKEVENLIQAFGYNAFENTKPEVRISSAFYCLQKGESVVYFLPKPLNCQLEKGTNHKELKAIEFISKSVWEKGLKADEWFDRAQCCIVQKNFVLTCEEANLMNVTVTQEVYKTHALPKVAVHNDTKENSFYHQSNIQIGNLGETQVHFYFLLSKDASLKSEIATQIDALLNMLPHVGIGGERTAGCGLFEDIDKKGFSIANDHQCFITVSLTNPRDKDEFKHFMQRNIVPRGGRQTGNDGLLNKVNMITEGSVVKIINIEGRILNISTSPHPYLRNGISFTLPYSISTP